MMKVSVFGLGYVGAVSCACLAELGHTVVGVDTNADKVRMVNEGSSPVVEDQIDELMAAGVAAGRIRATTDAADAVASTDMSLISVPTPARADHSPDLAYVDAVVRQVGELIARKSTAHTVVIRSTVQPGTTEQRLRPILESAAGRVVGDRLSLVFNPEFLREGSSVKDFHQPPQTVIGSIDEAGYTAVEALYQGVPGEVVRTTCDVAESVKYLCNVFHALKIVFANEAGSVLKAQGVDSREVLRIFCQDRQLNISSAYLKPGFAFGGSCLPKEVKGFLTMARQLNVAVPSMGGLLESNEVHIDRAYQLIAQGGRLPLALFGLAFKPGTDDLRDSPLVVLAERLIGRGYELVIRDPNVKLSRLLGKNKEFVEREVPHLDRLLVEDVDQALAPSVRTVIVGHATLEDRAAILAAADRLHVIDLAGYTDLRDGCPSYEGICW